MTATAPRPTDAPASPPSLTELRLADILPPLRDVLSDLPGDLRRGARQIARLTVADRLADPSLALLALLRRFRPRLTIRHLTLLTRGAEVTAVLMDSTRYRVTPYAGPMQRLAGPFALGLDGEAHELARDRLERALAPIDTAALGRWAEATAARLVDDARPDRRIDLVTELAQPLAVRFVADYFGVPEPELDPAAPGERMAAWADAFFEDCFLNPAKDRVVTQRGTAASRRLRTVIGDAVAARASVQLDADRAPGEETVLDRMVGARPDEQNTVVTDLIGLVVATVPTVSEAIVRVLDHLLDEPARLRTAAAAATAGDRDLVWQHAQESLRFNTQSPGLVRTCTATGRAAEDAQPGGGSGGHRRLVMVSTRSAMHDGARVPEPGCYRTDRPAQAYLHFGIGPHHCPGLPFARELMISAVSVLLREPRLNRLPGVRGRLACDGPSAARLFVSV